jgi:hypothetical protein
MERAAPLVFLPLVLTWLVTPSVGGAEGTAVKRAEESATRHGVQLLFLSRQSDDHLKAIGRTRDLPVAEALKLLVQLGLNDSTKEVRRAAYEALAAYKDDEYAAMLLQKTLERESRKPDTTASSGIIAALLGFPLAETQTNLDVFLDSYVNSKQGVLAVLATADELGTHDTAESLAALRSLSAKECCVKNFACRRATVHGILRTKRPEVVSVLIEVVGRFDGEVRADVVSRLTALTQQEFGNDVAAWREWWQTHKDSFKPRASLGAIPGAGQGQGGSFYGFVLRAKRLVFVIDISGSMAGERIATAKRELIQAINQLPEENEFGVVVFNQRATYSTRKLQPATRAVKRAAVQFVERLQADGLTATFDALDMAFLFDVEAVYFLSDGEPTTGRYVLPGEILSAVQKANYSRRISIYTIGISPGEPGSILDAFLDKLASQNYGTYRRAE